MVHRDTLKLRVETIEKADDPNTAKLTISSETTSLPMDFSVTVDSKSPHLITAIHLDFAEPVLTENSTMSRETARNELQVFVNKICKADMFSGAVPPNITVISTLKTHALNRRWIVLSLSEVQKRIFWHVAINCLERNAQQTGSIEIKSFFIFASKRASQLVLLLLMLCVTLQHDNDDRN